MSKLRKRNAGTASRVQKTAELAGVSERQVRRVINGESENEEVMRIYMFLNEGENNLLKAAKELVPFS